VFSRLILVGKGIVRDDLRIESAKDLSGNFADFAGADYTDNFAGDIESDEAVEREVVFANAVVSAVNFAIEGEKESNGMLSNGVRGISRHADDGHTELAGAVEIDVVESGAAQGEQLDTATRERFEDRGIGTIVDKDADGLNALTKCGGIGTEPEFVELPSDAVGTGSAAQVVAVIGFGVENADPKHGGN